MDGNFSGNGNASTAWRAVTRENPCPICGKPDWCTISSDGAVAGCHRVADGAFRHKDTNAGEVYLHQVGGSRSPRATYVHPSHYAKPKPARDWAAIASQYAAGADLRTLAESLGVPDGALRVLGVGYSPRLDGVACWTFPERDAAGNCIGINRRLVTPTADGKTKKRCKGAAAGLTFADGWHESSGPVVLVEGGSDVAAGIALGLAVIGRPSCTGGVELLARLLADHDRAVIVLGERDAKPDGRWPGREGATRTASKLATALRRPIGWALPPDDAKDLRSWYIEHKTKGRRTLLESLNVQTIQPSPEPSPTPHEPLQDAGEPISLDAWRGQMSLARVASLHLPGLYVDTSPTGAGKTFADDAAIAQAGMSLTILPTHVNCRERAAELVERGHDAAAWPERTPDNCREWKWASAAQSAGLSVGATVCRKCPVRDICEYIEAEIVARAACHLVCTHDRAARMMASVAKGRRFIAVHEDARNLLRPLVHFMPDDMASVLAVLSEAKHLIYRWESPDLEAIRFLEHVQTIGADLQAALAGVEQTKTLPLPKWSDKPPNIELLAWRAIRRLPSLDKIAGNVMRALLAIAAGELHELTAVVDTLKGSGGQPVTLRSFIATWKPKLPTRVPIWFADATTTAADIERLAGHPVSDQTPSGRLERQSAVHQVCRDISRSVSPEWVAAILRGILRERNAKRAGVIGHRPHVAKLLGKRGGLLGDDVARVAMHAYFGQGPDRASNEWLACDLLVVLGTPRVPPAAVRAELVRRGLADVAAQDGGWGPRTWEGVDAAGAVRVVAGRGYSHPEWHAAHVAIVRAGLIQAVGRGRGVLVDGVPVVVYSSEPVGGVLVEPKSDMQPAVWAAADAVRRTCVFANKEYLGKTHVQTIDVAAILRKSPSHTSRLLEAGAAAGLVVRLPGKRGGWTVPPPVADHDPNEAKTVTPTTYVFVEVTTTPGVADAVELYAIEADQNHPWHSLPPDATPAERQEALVERAAVMAEGGAP